MTLLVFDAGYAPIAPCHDLAGARAQVLVRIRDRRVFYTDAPQPDRTVGRTRHWSDQERVPIVRCTVIRVQVEAVTDLTG